MSALRRFFLGFFTLVVDERVLSAETRREVEHREQNARLAEGNWWTMHARTRRI